MTIIVFPLSASVWRICKSFSISWKCSPVVGSSKIKIVCEVERFESSVASLILCASPPERVVEDCPSQMYQSPTF